MSPRLLLPGAVCAAIALCAPAALAHPSLQPREARVGAPYRAVIGIPHGCDGSATISVRVVVPEGLIGVKPMAKPGWTISTVRGAYARSYPFYHGQTLSEGVKEVIWTGRLPDELYDELVLTGFVAASLPAGQTLYLPTYQECEKGAASFADIPAPGQDAHALAHPAPGLVLLAAAPTAAGSGTYKSGALVIEQPWARATPAGAETGAGYLRITNTGSTPDRLVGGTFAGAKAVEVHEMAMSGGVMTMRQLATGLKIAPGQTLELKPGGSHLMLTGLRAPLKEGEPVKMSLQFEKAGSVEIEVRIAPLGAQSAGAHSHH
jgi:uncharacterized protein YcnI